MRGVLRVVRNILAAFSLTALILVGVYMGVMNRMHATTRAEGGYVTRGWGRYRWF